MVFLQRRKRKRKKRKERKGEGGGGGEEEREKKKKRRVKGVEEGEVQIKLFFDLFEHVADGVVEVGLTSFCFSHHHVSFLFSVGDVLEGGGGRE